ncbi:MAG: J domain-containing protein [Candidatus Sulfotelmatobacter sp.]
MNSQIARRTSPEEEELARKREELALLQATLAERELFLTNLRVELTAFEGRYLRQVGTLYAELDDWNAKIAERLADEEGTKESRSAAARARSQAYESDSAVHGVAAKVPEFLPSAEMKTLYREVAKRVHPDLATDEGDRQRREQLMAEANAAYQRGDADALKRILEEYESSPESVRGDGIAADLVRAIRQIKQVGRRLTLIELEIERLSDSEIARLRIKADAARAEGRELLAEMAEDVRLRIDVARRRFEAGSGAKAKT